MAHLVTVEDFGLDRNLAEFMAVPYDCLHALVLVLSVADNDEEDLEGHQIFVDTVHQAYEIVLDGGCQASPVAFSDDIMCLRASVRRMLKRRKMILELESQACRQALPPDFVLSDERVRYYMKRHRDEFDGSAAQKMLVEVDMQKNNLSKWQAEKRRDNRYTAMLFDMLGGRKAIRHVIQTGKLEQVRLGQTHRSVRARPRNSDIPERRPRHATREKKAAVRAKYFGKMAMELRELRDAGVSTASPAWEAVKRRRVARVIQARQAAHLKGQTATYTTHLWAQHHLWNQGVDLPAVQWPKGGGKGSKGWWGGYERGGASSSSSRACSRRTL